VIAVADRMPNVATPQSETFYQAFRQRFPSPADDHVHMRMQLMVEALVQSVEAGGTIDSIAVAIRLERDSVTFYSQQGSMRAVDHQFQQPWWWVGWIARAPLA
jgi:branched-chain amino acid transport system substrate-binding protein